MSINLKSILKSGLVSGIFINLSAFGMVPIVGNQMDIVLHDRGLPPLSNGAMAFFACFSLVMGFSLVTAFAYSYNNTKSRIKTAIAIAFLFWFFCYFWANAALVAYGFMPLKLTIIGTIWGLLELLIASIIGSLLYKPISSAP